MRLTDDDIQCFSNDDELLDQFDLSIEIHSRFDDADEFKNQILSNQNIVDKFRELYNEEFPFNNNSARDWFADFADILRGEPIPQWALEEWTDLKKEDAD